MTYAHVHRDLNAAAATYLARLSTAALGMAPATKLSAAPANSVDPIFAAIEAHRATGTALDYAVHHLIQEQEDETMQVPRRSREWTHLCSLFRTHQVRRHE